MIETLVAAMVLVVALIGAFALLDASAKISALTKAREGATNLAREIVEDSRSIPFSEVAPSTIVSKLQAMNGLASASPAPQWQIVRRGYTYTVVVTACSVDEPKDSLAKTHDGTFCSGQAEWKAGEPADANAVDFKRVTVELSWVAGRRTHRLTEVGTLGSAGQGVGLSASELKLASTTPTTSGWEPTEPTITDPTVTKLTFSVTAPTGTAAMVWSLDGVAQSPAPAQGGGSEWTFSWTISASVSDGTYQVAAQAKQANGTLGPAVSIPVTFNRAIPKAPSGAEGGYNSIWVTEAEKKQVAEIQWQPNTERNVIGYRVYGPSGALICPSSSSALSLAASCIDLNPPAPTASNLTYSVVALYRDSNGNLQEGPATTVTLVGTPFKKYTFAPSTGNTGTNCTGPSGVVKKDMLTSYTPGADTLAEKTTVFCSNAFVAGEKVTGAGPLIAYFANESPSTSCTITAEPTLNGTQGAERLEKTIPANTPVTKYEFPFAYSGAPFEPGAGARVDVLIAWGSGGGCNKTKLHYGASTYPSSFQTVPSPLPEAPKPPTSLKVTAQANGTAILTWTAPASGATVSFYRIYRDGKAYGKRYDTSDTTPPLEYTDIEHASSHTYYVTAVGSTLAESEFAGPVTG